MEIRQTFYVTFSYIRFFFLRVDIHLFAFLASVAVYSVSYVGSFVMLFRGLNDFMGPGMGAVATNIPFMPEMDSHMALDAGIALLGISTVASLAMTYFASLTSGKFGASLVLRFLPQWDSLDAKQRKALISTGRVATTYGRLIVQALSPTVVFISGIFYLSAYNIYLSLGVLAISLAALFAFIPIDNVSTRITNNDFDDTLSAAELADQKKVLRTFMTERLQVFMARRFIRSANLLVLFLIVAIGFGIIGPERIVGLFNEQTVVVIVLIRSSILSLTRFTICLRMARTRLASLLAVQDICRFNKLPSDAHVMEGVDDDDDM